MADIVQFLVGVIFVAAALVKLLDLQEVFLIFEEHWVKNHVLAKVLAIVVPLSELSLGMLLVLGRWPYLVLTAVLAMLLVFTGALLLSLAQHKPRPCGCFGMLSHTETNWWTVVRNLLLLALTVFVLLDLQSSRLVLSEMGLLWRGMLGLTAAVTFLILIQLVDFEKGFRKAFRVS